MDDDHDTLTASRGLPSTPSKRNIKAAAMKKRLLSASLIGALLLQAACGGGGGGDNGNGGGSGGGGGGSGDGGGGGQPPISGTVSGRAGKGLLLNASVAFHAVNNGVVATTPLATVRTNSTTGAFSSTVTSPGAVVATLTVDGSTQVLDELSGARIAAPTGLVLHAVFPSVRNLPPLAITPLTEMAYTLAQSRTGGLSVANIDAANSAISTAFLNGAPVLQTLPIDIASYVSSTPGEQAQAKLLTALSVAADQNIATGADGAACTSSYPANVPCAVGGLSRLISVSANGDTTFNSEAAYLSAAYTLINSGAVTVAGGKTPAELGMNVTTVAENALVNNIQQQNPLPGYDASADPLQNTKDLVANIRTNILGGQDSLDALGFSATLDKLVDDAAQNVEPVISSVAKVMVTAYRCVMVMDGEMGSTIDDEHFNAENDLLCNYDAAAGTDVVSAYEYMDREYESEIVSGCDYEVFPQDGWTCIQKYTQRWTGLTITKTDASNYSVSSRPFERIETYTQTCDANFLCQDDQSSTDTEGEGKIANLTLTTANGSRSIALSGPIHVNGSGGYVTADLVVSRNDWDNATLSGTVSLSGTLSAGGGVSLQSAIIGAGSVVHVRNAETAANGLFYPEIEIPYPNYSCMPAEFSETPPQLGEPCFPDATVYVDGGGSFTERDGPPRTIAGSPPIAVWGNVEVQQWLTDGFSYSGKATIDEPVYDASNTLGIPARVVLDVGVSEVLPGGVLSPVFQGSMSVAVLGASAFNATQPISETNPVSAQAQVSGTLFPSSGRVLNVSATANVDRMFLRRTVDEFGYPQYTAATSPGRPASFSVTYRYSTPQGTAELNASGEYDSSTGLTGTITNNAGVIIALEKPNDGELSGTITANGVETASFGDNGFVYYTDGQSESVF